MISTSPCWSTITTTTTTTAVATAAMTCWYSSNIDKKENLIRSNGGKTDLENTQPYVGGELAALCWW